VTTDQKMNMKISNKDGVSVTGPPLSGRAKVYAHQGETQTVM